MSAEGLTGVTAEKGQKGNKQRVALRCTCAVAQLLWGGFNKGTNGSKPLQHRLRVISFPQQGRCIPQL